MPWGASGLAVCTFLTQSLKETGSPERHAQLNGKPGMPGKRGYVAGRRHSPLLRQNNFSRYLPPGRPEFNVRLTTPTHCCAHTICSALGGRHAFLHEPAFVNWADAGDLQCSVAIGGGSLRLQRWHAQRRLNARVFFGRIVKGALGSWRSHGNARQQFPHARAHRHRR